MFIFPEISFYFNTFTAKVYHKRRSVLVAVK